MGNQCVGPPGDALLFQRRSTTSHSLGDEDYPRKEPQRTSKNRMHPSSDPLPDHRGFSSFHKPTQVAKLASWLTSNAPSPARSTLSSVSSSTYINVTNNEDCTVMSKMTNSSFGNSPSHATVGGMDNNILEPPVFYLGGSEAEYNTKENEDTTNLGFGVEKDAYHEISKRFRTKRFRSRLELGML